LETNQQITAGIAKMDKVQSTDTTNLVSTRESIHAEHLDMGLAKSEKYKPA
jgi:hypothetical protein